MVQNYAWLWQTQFPESGHLPHFRHFTGLGTVNA